MRIAIDTLGADAPPHVLAAGALDAVAVGGEPSGCPKLTFFGAADAIAPLLDGTPHNVVHAPRAASADDPLRGSLRGDVPSSMRAAIAALAAGEVDGMVSAGATGSLLALSRHLIGTLPGVRWPAIIKAFGAEDGRRFCMLDLGANINAGAPQLHQFAAMGAASVRSDGLASPTVALLNIGSEVGKGPAEVREAARLIAADERIRYVGFVEPDRLFTAGADVVVADGFAGNIALKAAEGALRMARYLLQRELGSGVDTADPAQRPPDAPIQRIRDAYNPQKYNGARLLGLAGVVVKSHGGADREGFRCAVAQAIGAVSTALLAKVAAGV